MRSLSERVEIRNENQASGTPSTLRSGREKRLSTGQKETVSEVGEKGDWCHGNKEKFLKDGELVLLSPFLRCLVRCSIGFGMVEVIAFGYW